MQNCISFIKQITTLLVLVAVIMLSGCKGKKANENNNGNLKGTISISGAFALYPLAVRWAEEFKKIHPDVKIDISAGGAGKGMTDALSGMVDLGMLSREINKSETDKGAWLISVAKDAVLPTISDKNPVLAELKTKGMTRENFEQIFLTGNITSWGTSLQKVDHKAQGKINVYIRSDACGAGEMWGKYLGKNQESLNGIGVFGDPGVAEAVKKDPLGIGYNNVIYVYDIQTRKCYPGISVIPIDVNGNGKIDKEEDFYGSLDVLMAAIRDGRFPSPPARDLYFVSKGKPTDPVVTEFLKWILKDGQKYVNESGYVQLPDLKIKNELEKIK
jgi:phosphate transport system substrate-binding protein